MALWVLFILILLSATGILALTLGPLKTTGNTSTLRLIAGVQYALAAVLLVARLMGKA
ncbi:hypothetical protein [Deinococcus multiflagellatus]|uniref:HIG1 domain-containing protein n=1 Tax=Deinococcus multiflagellatus TaxID=1656887 RepID=A0ABW1ZFW3_9DEIO|nr:hypothetical protein [Deinococcus multiflagellatus]MBZ9712148.1 hypothetical protein [Deinococcus multiflagellatus]